MRNDVGIVEHEQSWVVMITKGRGMFCEVTIPRDVLEWFASVQHRHDKRELWSDWMDYTGYDDRTKEQLEAEMADNILAFIDRVSAYELVLPLSIHEEKT